MLDTLITSRTRLRLLVKFFLNRANTCHLRGLADELGESTNAIRKELNNLYEAGYLDSTPDRNRIVYRANTDHPLFDTISQMVSKHLGLDILVDSVLDRMTGVDKLVLTGDYARGLDTGHMEILIFGHRLDRHQMVPLSRQLETSLGRRVDLTLCEEGEGDEGLVLFERATKD